MQAREQSYQINAGIFHLYTSVVGRIPQHKLSNFAQTIPLDLFRKAATAAMGDEALTANSEFIHQGLHRPSGITNGQITLERWVWTTKLINQM